MKKVVLAGAVLALTSSLAQADGLRFSYVDAGLFLGDSDDYDATEARFRIRGNFGVGNVLYFPVAIESTALEFDDRRDYSVTDIAFTAGIGARINISESMAFYADVSFARQDVTVDYDGGFDDEDDEYDGDGHEVRIGWRVQPTPGFELNLELAKREIDDLWDQELLRSRIAAQFNFSPKFALAAELHNDSYDEGDYSTRYLGLYFRFSFK